MNPSSHYLPLFGFLCINLNYFFFSIDGNEGSFFQLQVSKSQDGRRVAYVHLETRKKLDREITPNFKLNITNGKGYLDLTVNILDINDNPPVFDKSEYKVNVNHSVAIGTNLVTVTANDADEGKNAILDYSIANGLDSVFKINANTGMYRYEQMNCQICRKIFKL